MINRLDPRLKSKWWRLTHLYKIKDKEGGIVTFSPNYVQLRHLAERGTAKRVKLLKYRQGGFTTLYCIDYLDDALWTPGFTAGIIAHEREALDKIFQIIERAYDNLPESIKPNTRQDTLRMLRFESNYLGQPLDSGIYVALKLRGGTVQALHISERAYIEGEKSQELEAGSKQAVPISGRISEETTANGFNEFHDSFMEDWGNSSAGLMDSRAFFYAWHEQPEYTLPGPLEQPEQWMVELRAQVAGAYAGKQLTDGQLLWYDWKMRDLIKAARASDDKVGLSGRQLMRQEYPSTVLEAFQSGLGNVFDQELLASHNPVPPSRIMTSQKVPGEQIKIWYEPIKRGDKFTDADGIEHVYTADRQYFIGCDPSDGTGGDAGCIAVWDENYKKCASFRGMLRPDRLAEVIAELGNFYNEAFVGVENNMLSCILFLSKIYENYFITVTVDEKRDRRTKKIGWTTTGKSRDIMIDDFTMHFEEESLEINDATTLSEMRTFVKKEGGKREHATGKSDDMLFADFIALQMIKHKDRAKARTRTFASKPQGL